MEFKEENGRVFVNGIEYVPKEELKEEPSVKEFPKNYAEIVGYNRHLCRNGFFIKSDGMIMSNDSTQIFTTTKGLFFNHDFANAMLKLKNLLEIRDAYNGDWKPNWNCSDCDYDNVKYCIEFFKNEIQVGCYHDTISSEFIFKSKELAGQFLKNHREDIEFVFKHLYMWNN